jgi:hypothetical protein
MNFSLLSLLVVLGLVGCSTTNAVKMEPVDGKLVSVKGTAENGIVGVDTAGQVVIQRKVDATIELRSQQRVNMYKKVELDREFYRLKVCVRDLSDPRLNGKGFGGKLPDIDYLDNLVEEQEQLGLDPAGNIVVVTRSNFADQFNAARKLQKTIEALLKVINNQLDDCRHELEIVKATFTAPAGYRMISGSQIKVKKAEQVYNDDTEN